MIKWVKAYTSDNLEVYPKKTCKTPRKATETRPIADVFLWFEHCEMFQNSFSENTCKIIFAEGLAHLVTEYYCTTMPGITCTKFPIETLKKGVKCVQS